MSGVTMEPLRSQSRLDVLFGSMFSGKCLKKGTLVLTYDGTVKTVEDLVDGDLLMGDDSKPRIVTGLHNGHGRLFTVYPKNNCYGKQGSLPYTVNENHILTLMLSVTLKRISNDQRGQRTHIQFIQDHKITTKSFLWKNYNSLEAAMTAAQEYGNNINMNVKGDIVHIDVLTYIGKSKSWKKLYKGYQVPVDFPSKSVTIDPYMLGVWLGDGTLGDKNFLITGLRDYGIYKDKHIPAAYLYNDRETRMQVLAGLIDTDGSKSDSCFTITQKRHELALDIQYLARSLGYRCSVTQIYKKCTTSPEPPTERLYYYIYIGGTTLEEIPTRLECKQHQKDIALNRNSQKAGILTSINIVETDPGEYFGFTVNGNQRFLLSDFTVTHNSSALIRKLTLLAEMGLSALYINHGSDNRAKTVYSTHSPLLKDQTLNISTIKATKLEELSIQELDKFDVIGIDEAQFFDQYLVEFVQTLVDVHKKYVIVVGLDGDFNRQKFGHILDLIPIANNVTKLHAYCKRCAEEKKTLVSALFTHYMKGSALSNESNVIVGGADKYEAVCRECYLELGN